MNQLDARATENVLVELTPTELAHLRIALDWRSKHWANRDNGEMVASRYRELSNRLGSIQLMLHGRQYIETPQGRRPVFFKECQHRRTIYVDCPLCGDHSF